MKWTNEPVRRDGLYRYTHIIRSPDDPERREKAASISKNGPVTQPTGWRAIARLPLRECARAIVGLLEDGRPRTFNSICVELWDKTADILFEENPDRALWLLVECGDLEHTYESPILFRLTEEKSDG